MADYRQVNTARRVLGLKEESTLEEIKSTYKRLALKHHPDKCKDEKKKECEEMFKKINDANDILMKYCAGYRYSFKEKDIKKNIMDEDLYKHLKRFYDGWFGNLDL